MSNTFNLNEITFGVIPSPEDSRDFFIPTTAIPTSFPLSFSLKRKPSIRNQGLVGSCVAHSLEYCYAIYKGKDYSTDFIYGYRPSNYYNGVGMITREALQTVTNLGDVPKSDLASNTEVALVINLVNSQLSRLTPIANKNKITRYAQLKTQTEVQTALIAGMPVVMTILVANDFAADYHTGILKNTYNTGIRGSHAMTIIGWETINNQVHFIVANSWGDWWGQNGFCKIPSSMLIGSSVSGELWSVASEYNEEIIRRTLRRGMKGDDVKEMQNKLLKAGEKLPKYGADSDFGGETEIAVVSFQTKRNLVADGICGPKTWGELDK